jgi:hypothetical protein
MPPLAAVLQRGFAITGSLMIKIEKWKVKFS